MLKQNNPITMKAVSQKIIDVIQPKCKMNFSASETMKQLRAGDLCRFWSWGAHDFINIHNKGLLFKVNGRLHRGWVFIALDYSDTYDVYIITYRGTIKSTHNMIYCDMLAELIDKCVETK